jgi:hypothetical protein
MDDWSFFLFGTAREPSVTAAPPDPASLQFHCSFPQFMAADIAAEPARIYPVRRDGSRALGGRLVPSAVPRASGTPDTDDTRRQSLNAENLLHRRHKSEAQI